MAAAAAKSFTRSDEAMEGRNSHWPSPRAVALEATASLRTIGLIPPLLLCLAVMGASLQEPRFFRMQHLSTTWPFIYASADLMSLCFCVVVVPWVPSRSAAMHWSLAISTWLLTSAALATACLVGLIGDVVQGTFPPAGIAMSAAFRLGFVWLPLSLLASSPRLGRRPLRRAGIVIAAFVIQVAMQGLPGDSIRGDKLLSGALALAGSLATMPSLGRRHPQR